jgi:phosphoglycolate phosphatase
MLTNKPGHHTLRILDILGVQRYFSMVLGGDAPLPRKPSPAGLLHLIAANGVSPDSTLMVGDSIVDLETARRGGTRFGLARYGFGRLPAEIQFETGDIELRDSTELAQQLLDFAAS